jgi:hypothetical protein
MKTHEASTAHEAFVPPPLSYSGSYLTYLLSLEAVLIILLNYHLHNRKRRVGFH